MITETIIHNFNKGQGVEVCRLNSNYNLHSIYFRLQNQICKNVH